MLQRKIRVANTRSIGFQRSAPQPRSGVAPVSRANWRGGASVDRLEQLADLPKHLVDVVLLHNLRSDNAMISAVIRTSKPLSKQAWNSSIARTLKWG